MSRAVVSLWCDAGLFQSFHSLREGFAMNKDVATERKLKIIGVPDDMIAQYQRYVDSGNRQGQERLLYRFRGMKNETLWKNGEN